MRHLNYIVPVLIALCGGPATAQNCAAGRTLYKNDNLPAVPSGAQTIGIVQGLCDNEAAMSVLQLPSPGRIDKVAGLFADAFGVVGSLAIVQVEVYDGATVSPSGVWTLGPRVYLSPNLQASSTNLVEHDIPPAMEPVITSGQAVIGFRMLQNLSTGSCAFGYDANFAVDPSGGCTPGRNIINTLNQGAIDPATYLGFGIPLCPLVFSGDWVIRACVEPTASITWTGNPTPGGVLSLSINAPSRPGDAYFVLAANGINNGYVTPFGTLPLDNDWLLNCSFNGPCASLLFNRFGVLNASGSAAGGLLIPNDPFLIGSNFPVYFCFFTFPQGNITNWNLVSPPSQVALIN